MFLAFLTSPEFSLGMFERRKTEGRFHYFATVFRVTGLPLLLDTVPLPFRLYAAVSTVCCYASYFSQVLDLLKNSEDLERTMETARIIAGAGGAVAVYGFLR
jgi:hypothetical protein